jgi:sugar O-acyltransferase (sialic acid O-acetyltransferase NeuD family)
MVRELLILGTGPHAREIADIVARINHVQETWNLVGFASSTDDKVGEERQGLPVFGSSQVWESYPEALVIAEPEWPCKSRIPRHRLASLIDPSSFVSTSARIGLGCIIYPHCFVGTDARIGDFLFCLAGSVINHEDVIDDGVTITSSVVVAGNVHVEADCYLGQSCTIRELTTIGRGSLIGMGSVVLSDVAPNSVMVGNPARKLGMRKHKLAGVRNLRSARWIARKGARAMRRKVRGATARVIKKVFHKALPA